MLVLVATNDLGSGAPLLRDLHRDALHRDGAALVRRSPASGSSSSAGYVADREIAARRRAGHDLAAPVDDAGRSSARRPARWRCARTARATSSSSRSTRSRTAASAAPASARARSRPRSGATLIPDVNTDFIYSALAQELGLVGVSALLLVFMVFVARGMKIALQVDDGFSKLLAAGLTFGFAFQTFIIVGGILRLIPLTGITLPFVSYGGSSIVANFLLLAGLLLVSHRANALA